MTEAAAAAPEGWKRPPLDRRGPRRAAGGFYRTAEGAEPGSGGVPLASVDAAVVAAVRLAYDVAEAQVDRSSRLARRLRDAGDAEAGPDSHVKAIDASERLVTKAVMSGLEWWETSVAEGRCPVKRLVAAEYQMLGSVLGFHPRGQKAADAPAAPEGDFHAPPAPTAPPTTPPLVVVHRGEPRTRRPVAVEPSRIPVAGPLHAELFFFSRADVASEGFPAELIVDADGTARLHLATPPQAPPGRWSAAICNESGEQLGFVEISL